MLNGAIKHSEAKFAISVTGVAGPGGGSEGKPVGTVWIGVGCEDHQIVRKYVFPGNRDAVRQAAMTTALNALMGLLARE